MNTTLAKHYNHHAAHNPKNFRAEAYQRKLEEKAQHWAETHVVEVSANVVYVTMPDGSAIKSDRNHVIDLLVKGWSQYRESN